MLRAYLRGLSSAHALAFLALMVALGGTLATAGNGPAPKRTAAYHVFDSQSSHSAGGRRSAAGPFVVSNVRMTGITLDAASVCPINNSQGPACKL